MGPTSKGPKGFVVVVVERKKGSREKSFFS